MICNHELLMLAMIMMVAMADKEDVNDGFANNGAINEPPLKMVVKRGQRAVLPCGGFVTVRDDDTVLWSKGETVVGTYRVHTKNPEAEAYIIAKVRDEDAGTYRCRVVGYAGSVQDHIVEIDVIVPPLNVSIRTDNNVNFEAGTPRVLACVIYGCLPSLKVIWQLGNTKLRPNVYKEVNRGNFTVSSLTFVPSLSDNGKQLVCMVTNSYLAETFEDRVTISVGHRPLCIDSGYKTIGAIEGDSETLVCMVESDPEPEQFIWTFADGRSIYTSSKKVSGYESRYSSTLVWVPREDDFGPLYCRASNRFGEQKQPCTFSVISGGPPTTPECEIFWEDKETLIVRCDKNWDGGRPQTIHLEVKGPDGTRKVSRKGNELKVDSLVPGLNFTAELYASNSRGRSLAVPLTLPRSPPANLPPESPFMTTQTMASWILVVVLVVLLLISVCYVIYWAVRTYCLHNCCFKRESNEGNYQHEMTDMTMNKYTTHIPINGTVSSSMEFNDSSYVVPMYQSRCPVHDDMEANIPAPLPRPLVNLPRLQPREAKISLDSHNYFL